MREHLKAFHLAEATHHITMGKHHKALADHYGKLVGFAKAEKTQMRTEDGEDSPAACCEKIAAVHTAMSEAHVAHAEKHIARAKELRDGATRKAMGLSDDDALEPSPISLLGRDAPVPVFRSGQQRFSTSDADTFSKIYGDGTDA